MSTVNPRIKKIVNDYRDCFSYSETARRNGLSPTRIIQILDKRRRICLGVYRKKYVTKEMFSENLLSKMDEYDIRDADILAMRFNVPRYTLEK